MYQSYVFVHFDLIVYVLRMRDSMRFYLTHVENLVHALVCV